MTDIKEEIKKDIDLLKNYQTSIDENHIVTLPEIINYFKSKGSKNPLVTGTVVFRALDKNHDMKISVDEITLKTINNYINKIDNYSEIEIESFIHQFDKNQHKKVQLNDMVKYLEDLGMKNSKDKVLSIFKQIGNEKEVDVEQLRNYFKKNYLKNPQQ